jgi:hypothetical protein
MSASVFTIPRPNQRTTVRLALSNPLAAVDRIFHGAGGLRGWGAPPSIDPVLYRVNGFDPNSAAFRYETNPRFGAPAAAASMTRPPFRLTLDVSVDLGRPAEEQRLEQNLRLRLPLVGTRAPVDSIMRRYKGQPFTAGFVDIYEVILRNADSIALSASQIERLQERQTLLRMQAERIYRKLAVYLHSLPRDYEPKPALDRVAATSTEMWEAVWAEKPYLLQILDPAQIGRLPQALNSMLTVPNFKGRFVL